MQDGEQADLADAARSSWEPNPDDADEAAPLCNAAISETVVDVGEDRNDVADDIASRGVERHRASKRGKGRSVPKLQALLQRAINVLGARLPRRHADFRPLRDDLISFLSVEACPTEHVDPASAVLARME